MSAPVHVWVDMLLALHYSSTSPSTSPSFIPLAASLCGFAILKDQGAAAARPSPNSQPVPPSQLHLVGAKPLSKQKLTSRNPLPFSTAALAIASLTNTSKYFPTAAFASLEILVESLVKKSWSTRVSRSLGIVFSCSGSSSSSIICTSREGPPASGSSADSKGSLDCGSGAFAAFLLVLPLGRPRDAPEVCFGGMLSKEAWNEMANVNVGRL